MLIALAFMICCSITCIYEGSHRLLKNVRRGQVQEVLQAHDAASFPITGSCVLFGLYVALKFIPKRIIGMMLSGYLTIAAVFALGGALRMITGPRFLTGAVSVAIGVAYMYTKHWILNNIMSISICITAIASLPISNFKTSSILLLGLFVYDVFWVFGTDVMVSVATGIDGPIKLLFPQTVFGSHEKKSLLGLGDIVIPGFFVSQTLVFSVLYAKRGTFYFRVAIWAYFLSLVNTMVVMVVFQHAQPALLYIVPWLLISTLLAALLKGDLPKLFSYDVELTYEKPKDKPRKKGEAGQLDTQKNAEEEGGVGALLWHLVKELFGFVPEEDDIIAATGNGTKPSVKEASPQGPAKSKKKQ